MSNRLISSASYADTKPHYHILDGLRGAAALMVVWYHVFEGFAFAEGSAIDVFNHGYLAVDFFFMLSGFVISYAYDDRWNQMSLGDFFKRRLVRLHPMIVMGAIIGLATFLIQGGVKWDGSVTPTSGVVLAFLLTCCIAPGQAGIKQQVSRNATTTPAVGVTEPSHFTPPWMRKVARPMMAPITIIGCRRTNRRLKKSPNDIWFQRSS